MSETVVLSDDVPDVPAEIEADEADEAESTESLVISNLPSDDGGVPIDVPISYEIIQLFSEGLYQSPQKAIEELVTNGFDAGADNVYVVLPSGDTKEVLSAESLFVIDDGSGIDDAGFANLWTVARSSKKDVAELNGRKPIGQFGIGKLAAFVLAWRLTHVSKSAGVFRTVSMDFHRVSDTHQWDPKAPPIQLKMHEVSEEEAKQILAEVEDRDPAAWERMFGPEEKAANAWTAAILSDFKNLFDKLSTKRLSWVLRTGLPLLANFKVFLDGDLLVSSKEDTAPLFESRVGGSDDNAATKAGVTPVDGGIQIPGIEGTISGVAKLYLGPLSKGKAAGLGRSHGFFVKVRGRVINLDDELFGISPLSHGAWSRFHMEVEADGLHDHLLSSREGVKDSEAIRKLREYLHEKFNVCRARWIAEEESEVKRLSLAAIRGDNGGRQISAPLIEAVLRVTQRGGAGSYYLETPADLESDQEEDFNAAFSKAAEKQPFGSTSSTDAGAHGPMATYSAKHRDLVWNSEHPMMAHMRFHSKDDDPVELLAAAEILTEAMLISEGVSIDVVDYVLRQRDRALRMLVGAKPPIAARVLGELDIAHEDKDALERATGHAFEVLGFDYTPKGGNKGGTDGILNARLGTQAEGLADFRIVYDTKATDSTSVSVQKTDFGALADFANSEGAAYGFFLAKKFDGESDDLAAINRRRELMNELGQVKEFKFLVMRVDQLKRLVTLHFQYGVTLTLVRQLFDECGSTSEIDAWLESQDVRLSSPNSRVPLALLLEGLEKAKSDEGEVVNIKSVRAVDPMLKGFSNEKLRSQISAVEALIGSEWISVNDVTFDVELHSTGDLILQEVHRNLQAEGIPVEAE